MNSHLDFGPLTTAAEVASAFSGEIRGKTILITGVSPKSLGEALALSLPSHSPYLLILASRTPSKLSLVASKIRTSFPSLKVAEIHLDLSSQKSVRTAAAQILNEIGAGKLDVIVNNAGINISERKVTEEGIEMQFGTNYVGPFLLTNLLMPALLRGKGGKVVIVSSEAHRISPVRFSDWNLEGKRVPREEEPRRGMPKGILRGDGGYEPAVAYGQSKTAGVLFAVGLNARLARMGVKSFALHPGTIMTQLVRDLDKQGLEGLTSTTEIWKTAEQGAATMLVAAFDPKLTAGGDAYLDDCQIKRPSKWASDAQNAEKLWKLSEELVNEKFNYGQISRL